MVTVSDPYCVNVLTGLETTTDADSSIELLIGFVAESNIQSVKRPTDDDVGNWYHRVRLQ